MTKEIESAPAAVVILPALCGPPGATRSSASGVQDVYCNPATTKEATWPRIVRAVLICVEGRRVVSSFRFLCNEKGMINQERIGAADGSHNRHLGQCAHALRCGLLTVLIWTSHVWSTKKRTEIRGSEGQDPLTPAVQTILNEIHLSDTDEPYPSQALG